METPRKFMPQPTAKPSTPYLQYQPNPQLDLTPDVFSNKHFQENVTHHSLRGNGYSSNGKSEDNGSVDIFGQPRHYSTVEVENGCINIRVPCVYNGPSEKTDARIRKSTHPFQTLAPRDEHCKSTNRVKFSRNPIPIRVKEKETKHPIFYSAVNSNKCGAGGFSSSAWNTCHTAKEVTTKPSQGKSLSRATKINSKMVWDFEGGKKVPFLAIDYGQELFEQAAATFATKEMQRKLFVSGKARDLKDNLESVKSTGSASSSAGRKAKSCNDFSKPRFHTSRHSAKALHEALSDLKNLPGEIENMVKRDKRFQPIIFEEASKALNVHSNSKIYKNLLSIDPDPSHLSRIESKLLEDIKLMQPVSRPRDPEPNIEDFNEFNYSRMKPRMLPTPPKPQSGVSINLDQDFHLIASEHKFTDEADRIDP